MLSTDKIPCNLKYYTHFATSHGKFKYLGEIYSFPKARFFLKTVVITNHQVTGLGHCDLVHCWNCCPPQILEATVMQPHCGFRMCTPALAFLKSLNDPFTELAFFAG